MLSPQLQRQLKHLPSNSAVDGLEKAGSSCLFRFQNATMLFFRRMTPMIRLSSGYRLLAITVTMLSAVSASGQSLQKLPVTTLNAGIHLIRAEVAATDANRQQGLMFREKLEPNEGMVFVFEEPVRTCMWMKNTLIPLSVAFIDQNGKIVNIEEMKAQSLESHCAAKPVVYALEMNRGWPTRARTLTRHRHALLQNSCKTLPDRIALQPCCQTARLAPFGGRKKPE
jgi:uncharacterized protein